MIVTTDYICTNLQERHHLSYYAIHIILKQIQTHFILMCHIVHIYPHPTLRIHLRTMFYQTFHDVNMSCHGCKMKRMFVRLKTKFYNHECIDKLYYIVRQPGYIRKWWLENVFDCHILLPAGKWHFLKAKTLANQTVYVGIFAFCRDNRLENFQT